MLCNHQLCLVPEYSSPLEETFACEVGTSQQCFLKTQRKKETLQNAMCIRTGRKTGVNEGWIKRTRYIYPTEHHSSRKEGSRATCSNMDGPRASYRRKKKEKPLTHICGDLENGTDEPIDKAETETQTESPNMGTGGNGADELGPWDSTDIQDQYCVQNRQRMRTYCTPQGTPLRALWRLNGKEIQKSGDTCRKR